MAEVNELLKEIKVPELYDIEYGKNIRDCFNNIDTNFKILANLDFTKGEPGETIYMEDIDLSVNPGWREQIKNAVISLIVGGDEPIYGYDVFTLFDANPGHLYMMYSTNGITDKKYISSLHYVFLDARFNRDELSKTADIYNEIYAAATDYSCTVVWDSNANKLVAMQNFPTLYYDNMVGFCWKINGQKTGISSQGPNGIDGEDGQMFIVKVKYYDDNGNKIVTSDDLYDVEGVYDFMSGEFVPVNESILRNRRYVSVIAISSYAVNFGGERQYPYWLTNVIKDDSGKFYAKCSDNTKVQIVITSNGFDAMLSNINIGNTQGPRGLYIPIAESTSGDSPAHMIYAKKDDAGRFTQLHISPVRNKEGDLDKWLTDATLNLNYEETNLNGNVYVNETLNVRGELRVDNSDSFIESSSSINVSTPSIIIGEEYSKYNTKTTNFGYSTWGDWKNSNKVVHHWGDEGKMVINVSSYTPALNSISNNIVEILEKVGILDYKKMIKTEIDYDRTSPLYYEIPDATINTPHHQFFVNCRSRQYHEGGTDADSYDVLCNYSKTYELIVRGILNDYDGLFAHDTRLIISIYQYDNANPDEDYNYKYIVRASSNDNNTTIKNLISGEKITSRNYAETVYTYYSDTNFDSIYYTPSSMTVGDWDV